VVVEETLNELDQYCQRQNCSP